MFGASGTVGTLKRLQVDLQCLDVVTCPAQHLAAQQLAYVVNPPSPIAFAWRLVMPCEGKASQPLTSTSCRWDLSLGPLGQEGRNLRSFQAAGNETRSTQQLSFKA